MRSKEDLEQYVRKNNKLSLVKLIDKLFDISLIEYNKVIDEAEKISSPPKSDEEAILYLENTSKCDRIQGRLEILAAIFESNDFIFQNMEEDPFGRRKATKEKQ